MTEDRKKMNDVIKKYIIPIFRQKGFTGSFPHFRRINDKYIDLLSFLFDKWGGGFVIEIAKCTNRGIVSLGWKIPPNTFVTRQINDKRPRLSPNIKIGENYWFRYDRKPLFGNGFLKISDEVISLINNQGEKWWSNIQNVSRQSL